VRHNRDNSPEVERQDWNRKHGEAGLLFGAEPNRFLVAEVEGLAPGRALDLACGAGRNAVWLAERGWTVLGADFSDVALENARGLAAERGVEVEWVQADLREWEPPARAFDLVVVLYLQVPGDELRSALGSAAEAVAPGGTILVVGHHLENLENGYGGRATRPCSTRQSRLPSRSTARDREGRDGLAAGRRRARRDRRARQGEQASP
jgi:SAM-dependent methyltransferase